MVIVGAQWGDEGKGKITDYMAARSDVVVRYQGGNNAGHTVENEKGQFKLHLIPSGILYKEKICIIGNGVVVDPESLLEEMDYLTEHGVALSNLLISDRAHLVFPYHKLLDALSEKSRGTDDIGTTLKGIGPCYTDKIARKGLRICDLMDKAVFADKLEKAIEEVNFILDKIYAQPPMDYDKVLSDYLAYAERLRPYVADTSTILYNLIKDDKDVLFEGAQGTLLDIDMGTYPYVTSSHPIAGGVCVGAGVGPTVIDGVLGVMKAYTTRVGKGPFPTELKDNIGDALREKGNEYGTTTGRPRRCGWFDAVIGRYSARINGLTAIALTKLDTLGGFAKLKVCIGYDKNGVRIDDFPASLEELAKCTPIYEELDGWDEDISNLRRYEDLPANAKKYVEFIEALCGVKVAMVAVGPKREQTIIRSQI